MMHTARKHPVFRLSLLTIPLLALGLLLVVNLGQGSRTASAAPGDGTAELHIDVTGVSGCSTGAQAGPNDTKGNCTIPLGGTFTVNGYMDGMGAGATGYSAFSVTLNYTGVTSKDNPSTASWPSCVFATSAGQGTGLFINAACARGVAPAPYSTYLGKVFTNDFNCTANGTITMAHSTSQTKVIADNANHTDGGPDVLNITCGAGGPTNTPPAGTPTNTPSGPTPTNTPIGPTSTVTPTRTPAPATATPTHAPPTPTRMPGGRGDVNGDGRVDATDSLWVLWQEAGIVAHVPLPENADANQDGHVNSIDALFILWMASGAI
jgi:hypothetical protein